MTAPQTHHDLEALQSRLAARLAAGLSERSLALPHDVQERLRVAREQAVARARDVRQARTAAATPTVGVSASGAALLGGEPAWWQRLASVVPLAVLVGGLLLIQQRVVHEQVQAAAEIDAVLLADDLPPDAYSDPGFVEYLKSPQP